MVNLSGLFLALNSDVGIPRAPNLVPRLCELNETPRGCYQKKEQRYYTLARDMELQSAIYMTICVDKITIYEVV
jgi:hypothetical protein